MTVAFYVEYFSCRAITFRHLAELMTHRGRHNSQAYNCNQLREEQQKIISDTCNFISET